jgi:membrane protease YdiL (CAAX protease family)
LTSEDQNFTNKIPCTGCQELIAPGIKFCNHCGATQSAKTTEQSAHQWLLLKQAAAFYAIYIVICMLSAFVDALKTIGWMLVFEVVVAGTAVIFFAYNWADNKRLLVWRNFSWQKLAAYGGIAMLGSFLVHYSAGWLNVTIFSKEEHYYSFFAGKYAAMAWIIFFTAVTPALFEELGFRGYLLQILLKVVDKDQAVYISAFLFAIIHLSFVSLFWLIPFALFIGYARVREDTLWYGVFFHFCFNLTACLFELL